MMRGRRYHKPRLQEVEGFNQRTGDPLPMPRVSMVAEKREKKGKVGGSWLVPEELDLHSGRFGGATRLAVMGAKPRVMQRDGKWLSDTFMVYVRANMDDPQRV